MSALELRNVSKHFGAIQATNDVSLTIEPGEVLGLMGDNGAGKSTLVKLIAGNFGPSAGEIYVSGHLASSIINSCARSRLSYSPALSRKPDPATWSRVCRVVSVRL